MFALGYVIQRFLVNQTFSGGLLAPLLVTFGLAVIIENTLLKIFSADSRGLDAGRFENTSIHITGQLAVGWLPLTIFLVAVAILGGSAALLRPNDVRSGTSGDLRRPGGSSARRDQRPSCVRDRDGHRARDRGDRRGVRRRPHHVQSARRSRAADLRVRGGDHRRPRLAVGHAGRRRDPRSGADARRARVAQLVPADRASGVPRGPRRAADRAVRPPGEQRREPVGLRAALDRREPIRNRRRRRRGGGVGARADAVRRQRAADAPAVLLPARAGRRCGTSSPGFAGLVSIGQQAYIGIGAYSLLVFADHLGANFFLSILLAATRGRGARDPDGRARVPAARRLLRDRDVGGRGGVPAADREHAIARRRFGGDDHVRDRHRPDHTPLRHLLDRARARRRRRSSASTR